MEIQTIHGQYLIIKRAYNNDLFEINLCKYEENDEDKLYTVIVLKDQDLIRNNIILFSSLRHNSKFTDFIECFSRESNLYVVFSYYPEVPLKLEKIRNAPLMERAEIIKQILSLIVILDIPEFMLYDVLSKENINLDTSGKVYFNYLLKRVDGYNNLKNQYYLKRIASLMINIFSEELQNNYVKGLKSFVDKCNDGKYKNQMDIYSDYVKLYDSFGESLSLGKEKKVRWYRRLLKWTLDIFNKLLPIVAIVALSIGVVYLIVIWTTKPTQQNPTKIESIGTVQVDQ